MYTCVRRCKYINAIDIYSHNGAYLQLSWVQNRKATLNFVFVVTAVEAEPFLPDTLFLGVAAVAAVVDAAKLVVAAAL